MTPSAKDPTTIVRMKAVLELRRALDEFTKATLTLRVAANEPAKAEAGAARE